MHESPQGQVARVYLDWMRLAYDDPSLTLEDLPQHWEEAWQRHDLNLKRYFAGRSNFFAFNISVPSEQADFCRFLRRRGYRIRGKVLPHAGARSA